ncbi:START domain-containing protein [Mucilaginibacter sp. OK098]|uniref:START domain-containing protein n=1 Tax=Mucilaginibacter sp. OK098 TaxID=1855297 RepID=UPI00091C9E83|nr:START domain-containing protein [Mucilaginibacter sp. OK098]SHM71065.1 START domain-containing protein [Mucilaginibacter sp. OK098]
MKKKLILLNIFFFVFSAVIAQGSWELKKNENGIAVYTRKPATGNLKELRVVCELDATKAQLISTLQDIGNYNDWVYSNKKSEILKSLNPHKIIYYTESRLPWPIKDRDLVVQLDINSGPEILEIQAKSLPEYLPQNKKFVRVPYSLAKWKVTQANDNKLKVDYTFSVDPGGNIPSWLVNATMAIGPYNSFVKLRELLDKKNSK